MLAKPLAACTYLSSIQFPSYTMLKSMRKSNKIAVFTTFLFPLGRPWGNHAKCCIDGKGIRCFDVCRL